MSKLMVLLMAVAVGPLVAGEARAQTAAPPPAQDEAAPPPTTGEVNPLVTCPPISREGRLNKDLKPGKGLQAAGGVMIGVGIATLVAGVVIAVEAGQTSLYSDTAGKAGGSILAVMGGVSTLVGIPLAHVGTQKGKKAQIDNARLSLAPLAVGGGLAQVGFQF